MRRTIFAMMLVGALLFVFTAATAIAAPGNTKTTLCHKNKKTITVGAPALKGHLKHGDVVGECVVVPAP